MNLATGFGCAGFNTYLGPIRPYALAILLYVTIDSYPGYCRLPKSVLIKWATSSFISLLVALTPEVVHFVNVVNARRRWWIKVPVNSRTQMVCTAVPHEIFPSRIQGIVTIDIPSMGCVACINKIDSSIKNLSRESIASVVSWLNNDPGSKKGGKAKVLLNGLSREDVKRRADEILRSITKAGFDCSIDTLEVKPSEQDTSQEWNTTDTLY